MRYLLLLCIAFSCSTVFAQKKDVNVLSYYAVTNSIDGQPFINQRNLLRFYPVFAFRDSITSVKITIYYGGDVFIENATKFVYGLYWEVKLPEFDLGDAIQRYEVETTMKYRTNVKQEIVQYKRDLIRNQTGIDKKWDTIRMKMLDFDASTGQFLNQFDALKKVMSFYSLVLGQNVLTAQQTSSYITQLEQSCNQLKLRIDTLMKGKFIQNDSIKIVSEYIKNLNENIGNFLRYYGNYEIALSLIDKRNDSVKLFATYVTKDINDLRLKADAVGINFKAFGEVQKDAAKYISVQERVIDTLKQNLIGKLLDKDLSGSGIQKSDIVFQGDTIAKILYRNYRLENRTLVALDPGEKLSIFRLRYIPFPVVGKNLEGPSRDGIPIVFEAGITFGNQVITSNEFTKPELSIRRFGIAVAFTPQLFSKDAKILALLLSYDFNAYASIGVGANFGTLSANSPETYFSFGINQKAFQRLVSGVANLFK